MSVSDQDLCIDQSRVAQFTTTHWSVVLAAGHSSAPGATEDRKSTRLNSSHGYISYAVFCLKRKNRQQKQPHGHVEADDLVGVLCLEVLPGFKPVHLLLGRPRDLRLVPKFRHPQRHQPERED